MDYRTIFWTYWTVGWLSDRQMRKTIWISDIRFKTQIVRLSDTSFIYFILFFIYKTFGCSALFSAQSSHTVTYWYSDPCSNSQFFTDVVKCRFCILLGVGTSKIRILENTFPRSRREEYRPITIGIKNVKRGTRKREKI